MPTNSADILRRLAPEVPAALAGRADAWDPASPAAIASPAASVILLRESRGALETYLLHRHAQMAFAASMVVFPGGRMDPVDEGALDPWRACAVRETLEETGVTLPAADLYDWAEWTTPEFEPRRYRTKFYVAPLPADQEATDVSGETDRAEWSTPSAALAASHAGTLGLMPPTRAILLELAELDSLADVLAAAEGRIVTPVLPTLVRGSGGWRFRYPAAEADRVTRTFPGVQALLAPNPGPMTLEGTNTWIVGEPTAGPVVVIDPGPDDEAHLDAVLAASGRIGVIVLTHRHLDHSAGCGLVSGPGGLCRAGS